MTESAQADAPLAVRMRPRTLGEAVRQAHLLRPGAHLRRPDGGGEAAPVLLYGPPGTGSTTVARLMAAVAARQFVALTVLTSGVEMPTRAAGETGSRHATAVPSSSTS
ncbi:AAA family ATPase [Streptomyces sp. NPDC058794]|uniref:AAA family ATPase n=1 Tax=Streptomyces sp. NPDC058794 TaxID=3346636 RepID=UPI0036ABF4BB